MPVAQLIQKHWRGELSPTVSVLGLCIILRFCIWIAWSFASPNTLLVLAGLLALDACLLIWQSVGGLRSLKDSDALWVHSAQAMACVAVIVLTVQGLDRAAPLFAQPAEPGAYHPVTQLHTDEATVYIDGPLDFSVMRGLDQALSGSANIDRVVLTSNGGHVFAARAMAQRVTARGLSTHVDRHCRSACALIFMAGRRRTLSDNAVLGFHKYRQGGAYAIADVDTEMDRDRAFFMERGVDGAFMTKALSIPHTEIWEPSHTQLRRAGVLSQ